MRTVELGYQEDDPSETLQFICRNLGFTLYSGLKLVSYPGGLHWHISNPDSKGVLEVTWWPAQQRFWLKIAKNREGKWISVAAQVLQARFGSGELL